MCPICWTLAVLAFFGITGTGLTMWVQGHGWLAFSLMILTSSVFWYYTYKFTMKKVRKNKCQCNIK